MKNLIIIIAIAASLAFQRCQTDADIEPGTDITSQINAFPEETLNEDEIRSLQFMREEEKLARDVYLTLYDKWKVNIFLNISSSEQTHADAVLALLNKYSLKDPVGNNAPGVFTDSTLQNLYMQLVTLGSASLLEAYKVGTTIEDLDIYDLESALLSIDNEDIEYAYDNLKRGSRNHMRAFYSQVISSGGSYSAQFISQSELEAIVNSPKEKGS